MHPKGEAFLAGGLEVPREESFQGVWEGELAVGQLGRFATAVDELKIRQRHRIQKGAKGEIEIPLPPFALAGEAARPQAMTFIIVCYNCYSLRGGTHLRWGQRDQGGLRSPP